MSRRTSPDAPASRRPGVAAALPNHLASHWPRVLRLLASVLCPALAMAAGPEEPWRSMGEPGIQVIYARGREETARSALDAARATTDRTARELGLARPRPIAVVLHPTHAGFARAAGIRRRDLVVGIAVAAGDTAHIDASGVLADVPTVVAHEVAHLLLVQATAGARLPRWFDEGYAEHASAPARWPARERLAEHQSRGRLFALSDLESDFPRGEAAASVAYDQSHALVAYILEHSPPGALPELTRRLRSGQAFPEALAESTGRRLADWDAAWRADFRGRFRWHSWVMAGAGATGILMAALCVLAFRAIRRRKEQLPE
ncbi:MAG: hypothetical protein HY321_15700 [Armatimonadetes bacterium]|nr:hypothetical protein [Armatimonadota bacterium]